MNGIINLTIDSIMNTLLKRILILFLFLLIVNCSSVSDKNRTPITCLNAGTPNAGCGCNCLEGFTSFDSNLEISPTKIKNTKIRIKQFPNLDWTTSAGPDISIKLYKPDTELILTFSSYVPNANGNRTFSHDELFNPPLESSLSMLELLDFVGYYILYNNDDLMYSIIFSTYVGTRDSNFPSSLEI